MLCFKTKNSGNHSISFRHLACILQNSKSLTIYLSNSIVNQINISKTKSRVAEFTLNEISTFEDNQIYVNPL